MDPVSFFIPAFNAAATLEASVHSVLDGNLGPRDELVVVDDGSSDGTWAILGRLAREFPRLRRLKHRRNLGGGAARNTGVKAARHALLFCLDSDNLLEPGSVAALRRHLGACEAGAAAFGEVWFFRQDPARITHRWTFQPGPLRLEDCLAGGILPISSGNYLFTRASWKKAGGYPVDAGALDAWGFGFRQVATGTKLVSLAGTHYRHRYGHVSYWVRDTPRTSELAWKVVAPYAGRLKEEDVAWAVSPEGRKAWFDRMGSKPLRLKDGRTGQGGKVSRSFSYALETSFHRVLARLKG